MILITLGIVALQVLYGICGYSGVIGLVYPVELLGLIFLYGFVLGAIQSYSRTCFVDVVPPGQEVRARGAGERSGGEKREKGCVGYITCTLAASFHPFRFIPLTQPTSPNATLHPITE